MSINLNEAKVYVGTFAKYNEGDLSGEWVDLSDFSNEDEFLKRLHEIHSDEDEPEFMFQDFENLPDSLISEYGLNSKYWDLKYHDMDMVLEYMEATGYDLDYALDYAEERCVYGGKFEDFAYDVLIDSNIISEEHIHLIDMEKWQNELGMDYIISDNYVYTTV